MRVYMELYISYCARLCMLFIYRYFLFRCGYVYVIYETKLDECVRLCFYVNAVEIANHWQPIKPIMAAVRMTSSILWLNCWRCNVCASSENCRDLFLEAVASDAPKIVR